MVVHRRDEGATVPVLLRCRNKGMLCSVPRVCRHTPCRSQFFLTVCMGLDCQKCLGLHPRGDRATSNLGSWQPRLQASIGSDPYLRPFNLTKLIKGDLLALEQCHLKTSFPPLFLAKSQLNKAVRAPPTWRRPVGDGANLTRTYFSGIAS